MGRGIRLKIKLSSRDRQRLDELLSGGLQSVRTVLRALALRQMDQGQSTPAVGGNLGLSAKAVGRSASAMNKKGWSGRCSMLHVRARLQRWTSTRASRLSP